MLSTNTTPRSDTTGQPPASKRIKLLHLETTSIASSLPQSQSNKSQLNPNPVSKPTKTNVQEQQQGPVATSAVASVNPPLKSSPAAAASGGTSPSKPSSSSDSKAKSAIGIPMRWLKPAVRAPTKKSASHSQGAASSVGVKKMVHKKESSTSAVGPIVKKEALKPTTSTSTTRPASPPLLATTNRAVTDSEGGSTVSNTRDLLAMLKEKKPEPQRTRIPAAIVTTKASKAPKLKKKKNPSYDSELVAVATMSTPDLTADDSLTDSSTPVERGVPATSRGSSSSSRVPLVIVQKEHYADEKADYDMSIDSPGVFERTEASQKVWAGNDNDDDDDCTSSGSDGDSDTDDEEIMNWAATMFGTAKKLAKTTTTTTETVQVEKVMSPPKVPTLHLRLSPEKKVVKATFRDTLVKELKVKKTEQKLSHPEAGNHRLKVRGKKKKKRKHQQASSDDYELKEPDDEAALEKARLRAEELKRKKETAKPLTAAQIRAIVAEDDAGQDAAAGGQKWVRRSVRQPSWGMLNSANMQSFVAKLRANDSEMVVLKMKKYVNDPNAPPAVLDVALDALEENSNCEALYIQVSVKIVELTLTSVPLFVVLYCRVPALLIVILICCCCPSLQNFNLGMRDDQLLHLVQILQQPTCKIWCLNVGELYNISNKSWRKFTKGLKKTKVTHMYASEHTITTEMKDEIRETIRMNRSKHDRHINPLNLDVIIQCTHCWWNPINATVLKPYIKKSGYEHILGDREAQGLRGTTTTTTDSSATGETTTLDAPAK
jgi:hypothetical protein